MPLPTLDPASFATLQSTLGPAGALSILQAQQLEQQKQLQQATTQATQQAQAAGQAYQQAAAAPVQEPSQLDQFLPRLLGGIASVVARDPQFAQRADQDINQQRKNLLQSRLDNLMALKDSWDKKAGIAERANDLEQTITARQKSEQISKLMEQMNDAAKLKGDFELEAFRQQGRMAEIGAQGQNQLNVERLRQSSAKGEEAEKAFGQAVYTTRGGNTFLDLTNFKGTKKFDAAVDYAAKNGYTPMDKAGSTQLRTADEVLAGLDQVEGVLGSILPHQTGDKLRDWISRQKKGVQNAIAAATQSESAQAAFGSTYPLAIRSLQAVAAGPGSGFRLNQSEINMIQRRWPKLNDNIETAKAKLAWERWFLKNKEQSYFHHDWRVEAEPIVPGLPQTGILGPQPGEDIEIYRRAK